MRYKKGKTKGSIIDLWRKGEGRDYHATVIVIDELNSQIISKPPNSKSSDYDKARWEIRELIIASLRRYRSVGIHLILLTQSARASEINFDGAQDNISYTIFGEQNKAMASSLGNETLALDSELDKKGIFYILKGNRLSKFRHIKKSDKF